MVIRVFRTPEELGIAAANFCEKVINEGISKNGTARIVLSTGASQFDTIRNLVQAKVDWSKVEMFHLDEYMGIPESHPASFRRYLKERFLDCVNIGKAYFVDGEGDVENKIEALSLKLLEKQVDLALVGIGENAHIAFNDPPADFDTRKPYIVVKLDDACKKQQVREGWFAKPEDVPDYAVSMSVHRIMQCRVILSCVPYKIKAAAIKKTLESDVTNMIPATLLKTHPDWHLYLDMDSASLLSRELIEKYTQYERR